MLMIMGVRTKKHKYVSNCVSMQYAIPEFEAIKPSLERLYGKRLTLVKMKPTVCGHVAFYYLLEEKEAANV